MKEKSQYYYRIHGNIFEICRSTHFDGNVAFGEPVPGEQTYSEREDARKRVYELNGWNYKPKTARV